MSMSLAHGALHTNGFCIVHVWLLLLLSTCVASQETFLAGDLCTGDLEARPFGAEASRVVSLLQTGLFLQAHRSAPEAGLNKYAAKLDDEILGWFSALLPSHVSPPLAASPNKKNATSKSALASIPYTEGLGEKVRGDKANHSIKTLGCSIVIVLFLAGSFAYSFHLSSQITCQTRRKGLQEKGVCMKIRLKARQAEHVRPAQLWMKHAQKKDSSRLMALFAELDEINQSEDSPPGYITRAAWQQAMADVRVVEEMVRLEISFHACTTVFSSLEKDGLVSQTDFVNECIDMGGRQP